MQLSIVTTLYKSAPYIKEFYARISAAALQITDDYEIIFVDDGSPDNSLEIVQEIYLRDPKIKIIELSRNFGHHKAMMTGLRQAIGNFVFLIDSDLEENPELLAAFWTELNKDHQIDVIYGVQNHRKGRWFERWTGNLYYKFLNKLSDEVKSDKNISTIRLMRKNYVRALTEFNEKGFYFGPVSNLVGFRQKSFCFTKRSKPRSSYNFFKKYHIFLDSIIAFSSKPLYFIFYFGILVTMISFLYMAYLILRNLIFGISIKGWTTIIVLISLFGGLNIFFMGILSAYIVHIFQETKNRPFVTVRKIYSRRIEKKLNAHNSSDFVMLED